MITYYLVIILLTLLGGFLTPLSYLPDASLPSSIANSLTTIGSFTGLIWWVMPLSLTALVGSVAIIVATENWIAIYKVVKWIYSKIPGVS